MTKKTFVSEKATVKKAKKVTTKKVTTKKVSPKKVLDLKVETQTDSVNLEGMLDQVINSLDQSGLLILVKASNTENALELTDRCGEKMHERGLRFTRPSNTIIRSSENQNIEFLGADQIKQRVKEGNLKGVFNDF